MYAWESIQRVLDRIEDNIAESYTPAELAEIAALSPFYFQRLFTRLVKRPVNEYVKMRRLARACETLNDKNKRILDIALENGFNSHEFFTKTFKAAFGITPEEYREKPLHLNQIIKPNLLLNYTMVDENVPIITDDIVIEITRKKIDVPEKYIGISGKLSFDQATFGEITGISGPGQIWDDFHRLKETMSCYTEDALELGASMMSEEGDGFIYFAGAAANPYTEEKANTNTEENLYTEVPKGFTAWELPAGVYIVCQFEAENFAELRSSAIDKALKYLLETWLPGHNIAIQPFSAEKYTNITEEVSSMEIWALIDEME
ncbi:MAG: AraC family transcriptional regulator [Treponema sp.]|jgi:AraC family transcriptional regulator|nr:AraC family transcriptional regulator [Treponema sp.]